MTTCFIFLQQKNNNASMNQQSTNKKISLKALAMLRKYTRVSLINIFLNVF